MAAVRNGENLRVFSPGLSLPVGKEGENDSGGNLKFIGTYRGLFEVSSVMNFEERKRFPQESFSARISHPRQPVNRD